MDVIDSVSFLSHPKKKATLPVAVLKEFFEKHEYDLPETNFVETIMNELEEEDYEDDIECPKAKCETTNDSDARFCKRCGTRLKEEDEEDTVELTSLEWNGNESCETFEKWFIGELVPHIKGRIEAMVVYGDPDDTDSPWKTFYFIVDDGVFTHCTLSLEATRAELPEFVTEEDEEEDDEDEEEEDDEDEDL